MVSRSTPPAAALAATCSRPHGRGAEASSAGPHGAWSSACCMFDVHCGTSLGEGYSAANSESTSDSNGVRSLLASDRSIRAASLLCGEIGARNLAVAYRRRTAFVAERAGDGRVSGEARGPRDGDDRDMSRGQTGAPGGGGGVREHRVTDQQGKRIGEVSVEGRLTVEQAAQHRELNAVRRRRVEAERALRRLVAGRDERLTGAHGRRDRERLCRRWRRPGLRRGPWVGRGPR